MSPLSPRNMEQAWLRLPWLRSGYERVFQSFPNSVYFLTVLTAFPRLSSPPETTKLLSSPVTSIPHANLDIVWNIKVNEKNVITIFQMTSWRLLRNPSHLPKLSQWFEGWCCYRHHLTARHLHFSVPSRDGKISSVASELEVMWRLREGQKARNFGMYHRKTLHTPYGYTRCGRVWPL